MGRFAISTQSVMVTHTLMECDSCRLHCRFLYSSLSTECYCPKTMTVTSSGCLPVPQPVSHPGAPHTDQGWDNVREHLAEIEPKSKLELNTQPKTGPDEMFKSVTWPEIEPEPEPVIETDPKSQPQLVTEPNIETKLGSEID